MATVQFMIQDAPRAMAIYGKDNTQRRLIFQGTAGVKSDTPGGSTATYVRGGIRAAFVPLEPIKAFPVTPIWVDIVSLKAHNTYIWSPGANISNVAISGTTLTVTANNNFQPGDQVKLVNLQGTAAPLNNIEVTVITASATQFTAYLGAASLNVATIGLAIPIRYFTPTPTQVGQENPLIPMPQGNVMIVAGTTELTAGSIPTANTGDQLQYRAEFVRSYH